MSRPTVPVLFDCDPGVDDGVALFLAFAAPDALELLGVTTVGGNVAGLLTARNACLLREWAGREDVPVHAGCPGPMVLPAVAASHFHGETGLGTLPIHVPARGVAAAHAVNHLIDTLRARPAGTVRVAITGPCTNLALAMAMAPDIVPRIAEVVVMGGARSEGGNITASAEYNFYADPHAAHVVLSAGCPVTVFGLDATHQVRSSPLRVAALRGLGTVPARHAAALLEFSDGIERSFSTRTGAPLHDPCVIAYLLAPHLFTFRPCVLRVDTSDGVSRGHSDVEFRIPAGTRPHVRWALEADEDGVFDLLMTRLAPR